MERILVVDDEAQIVRLLQKYFASKGYEVHTAGSGLEAVDRVKDVRPDVVLLDILMPGMGGLDALKEIKKIDPKIGVIMVTAVIDEELAKRALELGADDYITKPIDFDYLETCVMVKLAQLAG
jgi:CheY-like chemotaxis protein